MRVRYVHAETYREGLRELVGDGPVTVHHPTSYAALRPVRSLDSVTVLPARGFLVAHDDFRAWADGHGGHGGQRLRQEDFYRWVRRSHDLLMDGDGPAGDRRNHDHDNRGPPPKGARTLGAPPPFRPREDEMDEEVRHDLERWERDGSVAFVGRDGPRRFPASRREALAALRRFVEHRLAGFGPYEDAMRAVPRPGRSVHRWVLGLPAPAPGPSGAQSADGAAGPRPGPPRGPGGGAAPGTAARRRAAPDRQPAGASGRAVPRAV